MKRSPQSPAGSPAAAIQAAARAFQQGDLAAAEQACRQVLDAAPREPEALHLLGLITHRRGDGPAAKGALRKAIRARPGVARFHNSLAVVLRDLGEPEAARAALERALRLRPRFPGALYNLGLVHEKLGDPERALSAYESACEQDPGLAPAHDARGLALQALGRLDEARDAYRRALAAEPAYAEAHFHLAHARRAEPDDTQARQIETLLAERSWPPRQEGWLQAALGKLRDDLADYDRAFSAYRRANDLVATQYDPETRDAFAARLAGTFTGERLRAGTPAALSRADRIFIVGLPRSGTTLLEAMLAAHPEVEAGGERKELREVLRQVASEHRLEKPEDWIDAGPRALERTAALLDRHLARPAGARYLADKLPGNLWHLWAVGLLLPRAPVLFAWRDPRDVGLSCYFTRFEEGQGFSYDLYHCGREIRAASRLMGHWLSALPNPTAVVSYERLVTDPEATLRDVRARCGLGEAAGEMDHREAQGAVETASSWQVRQGLYRRAIGRWRHYERHLGPLLEGLGPAASADPPGS